MNAARQQGLEDGRLFRLRLPRRAFAGAAGAAPADRAGESLEFQDYRDYEPGDDLRNLDWNVLARTGREIVKVRRAEVAPVVEIVRDRSASMATPPAKSAAADYVCALIAAAAPACRVVERDEPETPRAIRLFVSDLLTPDDPLRRLDRLMRRAAAFAVVRILAREETDPPRGGAFEFVDSETGERRELELDGELRGRYLDALAAHTARWTAAARGRGAAFADVIAEDPPAAIAAAIARGGIVEARR